MDESIIIAELVDLVKKTSRLETQMSLLEKSLEITCNQMHDMQKEMREAAVLMGKITHHLELQTCPMPVVTQIAGNVEGDVAGEQINKDTDASKE